MASAFGRYGTDTRFSAAGALYPPMAEGSTARVRTVQDVGMITFSRRFPDGVELPKIQPVSVSVKLAPARRVSPINPRVSESPSPVLVGPEYTSPVNWSRHRVQHTSAAAVAAAKTIDDDEGILEEIYEATGLGNDPTTLISRMDIEVLLLDTGRVSQVFRSKLARLQIEQKNNKSLARGVNSLLLVSTAGLIVSLAFILFGSVSEKDKSATIIGFAVSLLLFSIGAIGKKIQMNRPSYEITIDEKNSQRIKDFYYKNEKNGYEDLNKRAESILAHIELIENHMSPTEEKIAIDRKIARNGGVNRSSASANYRYSDETKLVADFLFRFSQQLLNESFLHPDRFCRGSLDLRKACGAAIKATIQHYDRDVSIHRMQRIKEELFTKNGFLRKIAAKYIDITGNSAVVSCTGKSSETKLEALENAFIAFFKARTSEITPKFNPISLYQACVATFEETYNRQ